MSSPGLRFLAVAVAALLVCDAAAAYQVGIRARRPPSFRRGGRFLQAAGDEVTAQVSPADVTTTTSVLAAAPAPPSTSSGRTTTSTPRSSATNPSAVGSPSAGASSGVGATATVLPATGSYTWAVSGTESASGFGSRDFPPTMTMVAHRDQGLKPEEIVLDSTYSSNHSEREIVGYEANGIFFDFEGGQVRFGPSAQTNQGDYRPPMLQVPLPLAAGAVRTGTTQVLASDGTTERTETWTVQILGQETIQVGGVSVPTWKITVDRHGSGGNQKVDRSRVVWFDPGRHLWVKYTEKMHGQQNYGVTFTYDEDVTATLQSFAPG